MKKILIVGAGFSGAVIARELKDAGFYVKVIDARNHIGGNCYDYTNEYGIRIHKYGPHIFHTNNKKVVDWLLKYGDWNVYCHRVKAQLHDGRYVTIPPNRETKEIVGEENIVDTFFRPYTKKMWDKDIEELSPDILNRVPIRDDDNELYFPNDEYQMMPSAGYTEIFENILDGIDVSLNVEFDKEFEKDFDHVFNSMPIDKYFGFTHGALPYRSIKFHTMTLPSPKLLPVPTVNFTHSGPYTRMTEWKNYPKHGWNSEYTTVTYEEPCDYSENDFERYYPVKDIDGKNRAIYKLYKEMVPDNVTFIGRCGQYVYLDMHQAISNALSIAKDFIKENA